MKIHIKLYGHVVSYSKVNDYTLLPSHRYWSIPVFLFLSLVIGWYGQYFEYYLVKKGFPRGSDGKASVRNAGDSGSIPGLGRSPGEGNGNPLQYSCLENPMDREAW